MNIKLIKGDCLQKMNDIPDKSKDLILCDLPYGTTKNKWDSIIPLNDYIDIGNKIYYKDEFYYQNLLRGLTKKEIDEVWTSQSKKGLWTHYNRIIKDNGAILLFAQVPFNMTLGNSNLRMLKYEWIWEKTSATGHLNAKKMPMKAHENILVFYKKPPTYNPIKTTGHERKVSKAEHKINCKATTNYGEFGLTTYDSTERYPRSVITFPKDIQKSALHPTQKPVGLLEYFIKTYSNEGDEVLDNCMGVASTGIACLETNRNFEGIELESEYFETCKNRVNEYIKDNNLQDVHIRIA